MSSHIADSALLNGGRLTTRQNVEEQDSKGKAQYYANHAKTAQFAYLYDLARAALCPCVIRADSYIGFQPSAVCLVHRKVHEQHENGVLPGRSRKHV